MPKGSDPTRPGPSYAWRRGPGSGTGRGDAAGAEGELRYDYEDSQVPLSLAPGVRVVHPRFGVGEILQVHGYGRDARVDIDFAGAGRKKVVVAYAGLRPA